MRRFWAGFGVASALWALVVWVVLPRWTPRTSSAVDAGAAAQGPIAPEKRRRRRAGAAEGAPPLRAADLRIASEGDNLNTPDVIEAGEPGPAEELPQEALDGPVRARQDDLLACIERAKPTPETAVSGTVTVHFRVARGGTVRGVRVDAPAILLAGGLYRCLRPIVAGLRFPRSGQSVVAAYPFRLE
jgi:hypothetical protein